MRNLSSKCSNSASVTRCNMTLFLGTPIRTALKVQYKALKRYATSTGSTDPHEKQGLHSWPTNKDPDPLEIFDLKQEQLNLSQKDLQDILKVKYSKLVKIYHPDLSKHVTVYDNDNKPLTEDMKRIRFDQVKNSYDLLKDTRRRIAFKTYNKTTWSDYSANTSNFHGYRMANSHRPKYRFNNDEEFWMAGTWEDYYRMKYKRRPPTAEELEKNKYKILAGVLLVAALSFSLQIMLALDRSNEYLRQANMNTLKSMQDLQRSHDNYGEGLTKFERLKRFLIQRRSYFIDEDNGKVKKLKEEDEEILAKYAS